MFFHKTEGYKGLGNYTEVNAHQYTNTNTKNQTTSTKCQYHAEPSKATRCVQKLNLNEVRGVSAFTTIAGKRTLVQ